MSSHQQIPFNKKKPSISNAYPQKIESVLSGLFQIWVPGAKTLAMSSIIIVTLNGHNISIATIVSECEH